MVGASNSAARGTPASSQRCRRVVSCTAEMESPPSSKKSSSTPGASMPRTSVQSFASSRSGRGAGRHGRAGQPRPRRAGRRQRLAIELAAGTERQLGEEHPALGHQVLGHPRIEPAPQFGDRQLLRVDLRGPFQLRQQLPVQARAAGDWCPGGG